MDFHIPPISAAPDLIAANLMRRHKRAGVQTRPMSRRCRHGTSHCVAARMWRCARADTLNRSLYPDSSVAINFATASNEIRGDADKKGRTIKDERKASSKDGISV